jgi:EAL domain
MSEKPQPDAISVTVRWAWSGSFRALWQRSSRRDWTRRAIDVPSWASRTSVALDDFGTGYASLSHLKQFPVNVIKIDHSFVSDVETDAGNAAIVKAMLSLGQSLGIRVVAEGVETASQASFLREHGCDVGQGYHFGRPMPAGEAEHFLTSWKPDPLIPRPCEP